MRFIWQMTRGLVRDQSHRRTLMFVVLLGALLLLFLGSTFMAPVLMTRPVLFVVYWLLCVWLTFLAFLLAAYDLLLVRKAERAERARLRKKHFSGEP